MHVICVETFNDSNEGCSRPSPEGEKTGEGSIVEEDLRMSSSEEC